MLEEISKEVQKIAVKYSNRKKSSRRKNVKYQLCEKKAV